ncbi:hypothetical protein K469DRAFT_683286 [Zopfia rhizophila CBS 207.26]|uniref:DUF7924 domain-containing protein n=1 Tax=Zopfia rhizophila CBS 207.26 TaxID=1314779 RepID=A0A6A6EIJ2_9PEZI|nr:hypothetical protein K469DRAFT_683286 [Zopfia rhizophila CBS 207.26]
MIQNGNKARIIRDIGLLIVPSAEHLAVTHAEHLKILTESVSEDWDSSMPITTSCPRPDYSVGFKRQAFTPDQLQRLEPFVGDLQDEYQSYFLATWYTFFPFLTCEAQPGGGAHDVANRKNAHSTALAVRAVVELFRLAKREEEIDREILAFSVSYDNSSVSLYGHYPVIENKDTK